MMQFIRNMVRIFWLPTLVLVLNFTPTAQRLMDRGTGFDKIIHAIGGAAIAYISFLALRIYGKNWWVQTPWFVKCFFVIMLIAFSGVAWEVYEFASDTFRGTHMQPNNADTMGDLITDILFGALAAFFIAFRNKKSRN